MDFLYPIEFAKNPYVNVPKTAPKAKNDPIQPVASFDNGPSCNGVWSDNRVGRAGEYQPILHPWENVMKFPNVREEKSYIKVSRMNIFENKM